MIKFALEECDYLVAEQILNGMPIYEYSHREEQANEVGVLGEVVAEKWLRSCWIGFADQRSCTTHDYLLGDGFSTFDVKTKDRTVPPKPHYECSVPLYNHDHQLPTYYLFVSLERGRGDTRVDIRRFHTAYLLGGLNQKQLNAWGELRSAGETDPDNGTTFWTACLNVKISRLAVPAEVRAKWLGLTGEASGLPVG